MIWQKILNSKRDWFLGLILFVALGLRAWGIGFGLPYIYHVDEHYYINTALKLGAGILNNPPHAPTGLSNILFSEYGLYFALGRILGLFSSGAEFEAAFRSDPSPFYLIGRFTSALLGAGTVLALYVLGKYAFDRSTGIMAAAFLAVSFLHVRDSHYAVPDVGMAFFVVLAVTLAVIGVRFRLRKYIYLAALAGGLAIAVKWTALPVCLPLGWASLCIAAEDNERLIGKVLNSIVLLTILLFILGFALGSPQILINPAPYISEAFGQLGADQKGGFGLWVVDDLPGWLFYLKTLWYGMGPALLIFGIMGVLWQAKLVLKSKVEMQVLLLLFPIVYYLLMGSTRHYFARYTLPLIPFVALFAASFVSTIIVSVKARQAKMGWSLGVLLILAAMTTPLLQSIQHNLLLTRTDTRTLAKEWIEENIPAGTKIAVDWPTHAPPLSTPEKMMPDSHKIYEVQIIGETGLARHPIFWYTAQEFDYLIASSFIYNIPLVYEDQNAARQAFYASLDQKLELIQEFRPHHSEAAEPSFIFDEIYGPIISLWQRERPGPTVKIYRLDKSHPKVSHQD